MTTPAGWYPDPSGAPGQRYFDGIDWIEQFQVMAATETMPDTVRMSVLDQAVMYAVTQGGRVESRTQLQGVIVYGQKTNHVLHAILTIFTCLLWAIVWITKGPGNERREVLQVDPYGNLIRSGSVPVGYPPGLSGQA